MTEYHDEQTMSKVREGLQASGLTNQLITDSINEMQNRGILFRENRDDDLELEKISFNGGSGFEVLIVLDFNVGTPEDIVKILKKIKPPELPFFGGHARIVVGDDVTDTIVFLDGEENVTADVD